MNALFMDRDGEVWRTNGRTPAGEQLLACDEPSSPADRGTGDSFPWTVRTVRMWFGPLVEVSPAVAEQAQLAAVDTALHVLFGGDESRWSPEETAEYLGRIDGVHGRFHPEGLVA